MSAAHSSSSSANTTEIREEASLATASQVGMSTGTVATSLKHTDVQSSQPQNEFVTPDKSPKSPREELDSSSSSEEESEPTSHASERSLLISQIDTTKLSPDIDPDTLSNYELLRLRNIQRNEAKLASLGLIGLTTKDKKTKKATNAKPNAKPANNNNLIFWHTRYKELVAFHSAHGHLTVPTSHGPLYAWTKRQKAQYKSYKEGKKCSLDDERAGMLERLGVDEYWFGIVRTVVNNRKNDNKLKKTKNHSDSADEEDLGSLDSYSEEEEELDFPPDKSRSRIRRELERLASPKWMDGYSDDDKSKSTRGRSSTTRMPGGSSRYGVKSINPKDRSVVDDYSDNEAYYQTRWQGDSTNRGKPSKKRMEQRSERRCSDNYEPDDFESDDIESEDDVCEEYGTSKARSGMTRREGALTAYESSKTPVGRGTTVMHSDDDFSVEFEAARCRNGASKRRKSHWNRGGQRSTDDSSDDATDSVDYEDSVNRDNRSVKRHGGHRLVDDDSDDDAHSSEYDDEYRRTSPSKRSRLIQKHRGRKPMGDGTAEDRQSVEKRRGCKSKDYSVDCGTNSFEYSTAKRFARSSKSIKSTRMREEGRLIEDYSRDGESRSLQHASTPKRDCSSKLRGIFF